jgi:hypothetical protein
MSEEASCNAPSSSLVMAVNLLDQFSQKFQEWSQSHGFHFFAPVLIFWILLLDSKKKSVITRRQDGE